MCNSSMETNNTIHLSGPVCSDQADVYPSEGFSITENQSYSITQSTSISVFLYQISSIRSPQRSHTFLPLLDRPSSYLCVSLYFWLPPALEKFKQGLDKSCVFLPGLCPLTCTPLSHLVTDRNWSGFFPLPFFPFYLFLSFSLLFLPHFSQKLQKAVFFSNNVHSRAQQKHLHYLIQFQRGTGKLLLFFDFNDA